jgi:hypothetical protein
MKLLKKCGGVPLAIMAVASCIADKKVNPGQWDNMFDSVGTGLGDSPDVKNMRSILSLSYYSLPSHLRTCLLYLSVYPEDYEMPRDDIIWKWIAEGFITHENNNVFEVGAGYFRDLINRCMLQPCIDYTGDVTHCRLHDMVLDFICSLSTEENFVTILNHVEGYSISSSSNVRRLSIQNRKDDPESTPLDSISKSQVRSVTTFPPAINQVPSLSSFDVLRVLDLSGCNLGGNSHINLKDVGNLVHLRYLGLAGTEICQLPLEIGKLQFLQVLDVKYNYGLEELPSTIYKLRRLKCLRLDGYRTRLPDGLGSLRSMEVLKKICANPNIVKELRNLSMLRELKIKFKQNASLEDGKAFVESLCHLKNISYVAIREYFQAMDLLQEHWVPPPQLRTFESVRCGAFSTVPKWIKKDPLHLANLFELVVGFEELREEDMWVLGRLPALRRLWMWSGRQTERVLPIGADGFHCLTTFTLYCASPRQIAFQQGAFPRVEGVLFNFDIRTAKDDGNGDFIFGLGNLVSLRQVTVGIDRYGATLGDVKEAVVALRHAVDAHENHPSITVDIRPTIRPDEVTRTRTFLFYIIIPS